MNEDARPPKPFAVDWRFGREPIDWGDIPGGPMARYQFAAERIEMIGGAADDGRPVARVGLIGAGRSLGMKPFPAARLGSDSQKRGYSTPLSMKFSGKSLENQGSHKNQSDRFESGLYCLRSHTGGFRSAPNLWNVGASAGVAAPLRWRGGERECSDAQANDSAIVEEVADAGLSNGPQS